MRALPVVVVVMMLVSPSVWAWGGLVHREIARHAVGGLVGEARTRLAPLGKRIVDRVMDADDRVGTDKDERPRHYCDLEEIGASDPDILSTAPPAQPPGTRDQWLVRLHQRVEELGAKRVGVLPDALPATYARLVEALRNRDDNATVQHAADLLHYLGDAHQPLHATRLYDGMGRFQKGVHAEFETDFPRACRKSLPRGPAGGVRTEGALVDVAWDALLESHALAASVLARDLGCTRTEGLRVSCSVAPAQQRVFVGKCDPAWMTLVRIRSELAAARGRDLLARAVKDARTR